MEKTGGQAALQRERQGGAPAGAGAAGPKEKG